MIQRQGGASRSGAIMVARFVIFVLFFRFSFCGWGGSGGKVGD